MEQLKASIPANIGALILSTPIADLTTSCAALVQHFSASPQFFQLLEQLVNPDLTSCSKDAAASTIFKGEGNAAFGVQNYNQALSCYTKALRYAPLASDGETETLRVTLFVNRAAALHKLGVLESALRDCDRAIDICPSYSKAWYRRGLVKSHLRDFHGAVADMETALAKESTAAGELQIRRELKQMEVSWRSAGGSGDTQICSSSQNSGKTCAGASGKIMESPKVNGQGRLQRHWTKAKGWSLRTNESLPIGSLIFQEDPYAAVVLKPSRDTHCHFCFELLPVDPVACSGCSIPLYCSDLCRSHAMGACVSVNSQAFQIHGKQKDKYLEAGVELADPSTDLFQGGNCELKVEEHLTSSSPRWGEHRPECGGASWSAVLPTDAILGARMLFQALYAKSGVLQMNSDLLKGTGDLVKVDSLCHHYDKLSPTDKLELHVLGVVIAHCVRQRLDVYLLETEVAALASKLVGLIARARVNAMAIFGMSSPDFVDDTGKRTHNLLGDTGENSLLKRAPLCSVEQVKVAQGIFFVGSGLNHSCVPNVHASFVSGRLFIRSLSNIAKGSALELCYGPQVGQLSQLERKQKLLERYFFTCSCPACSNLTLPDLFLQSFKCARAGCMGIVLGPGSVDSKLRVAGISRQKASVDVEGEHKKGAEGDCLLEGKDIWDMRPPSIAAIELGVICEDFAKASLVSEEIIGRCLGCGTVVDIEQARVIARSAIAHLERVESNLVKSELDVENLKGTLKGALKALDTLKVTLHAYNELIAKGEDIVARLMCALDQPMKALKHCERSIEVLEHLYTKQHIVIGNEHLKLASVALAASNVECATSRLAIVDQIFSVHYGSDYQNRLPYVARLQQIAQ